MSQQSLERAIPGGATLLLDTSVLIAYFAGDEQVPPVALHLIDRFVREARDHLPFP